MYGILIAIVFIYFIRYRIAKGSGTLEEFKELVSGRILWIMTCLDIIWICILFVYGDSAPYYWEAVILASFTVLTNPLFIRLSVQGSLATTIAFPVLIAQYAIIYMPFAAGNSFSRIISLLGHEFSLLSICLALAIYFIIAAVMTALFATSIVAQKSAREERKGWSECP